MPSSKHALIAALRDVLAQHGVTNARVLVELQPDPPVSQIGGITSSEVLIVVSGAEDVSECVAAAVPAEPPVEPPKPRPPPKPRSPRNECIKAPPTTETNTETTTAITTSVPRSAGPADPMESPPVVGAASDREAEDPLDGTARPSDHLLRSPRSAPTPNARPMRGTLPHLPERQPQRLQRPARSSPAPAMGGRQRLLEMLQEQRAMADEDAQSRIQHDALVRDAERCLEELRRTKAEANGGARSPKRSCSAAAPTSPCSSASGIKVVKFTMPKGEQAKEEVVAQLSTSQGGAQHVSSRDKFSLLFREQEKALRAAEAGEEEYQKLLQQAIEYHKQRDEMKRQQRVSSLDA